MASTLEPEIKDLEQDDQSELSSEELSEVSSSQNVDMKTKIENCLRVIFNYSEQKNLKKNRKEYIKDLYKLVGNFYDFNEFLCDKFFHLYSHDMIDAIEASEEERGLCIRENLLKISKKNLIEKLTRKNVKLENLGDWTKFGIAIKDSPIPIGASTEYLCGMYSIQGGASFLPVIALDPQPNSRVLDMCSSPGGKTTFIGSLMKNTGTLVANELNKERMDSVFGNIHRCGLENTIICCEDGRRLPTMMKGFDYVLLDAPCSGTGIISKDKRVKNSKDSFMIQQRSQIQKELLAAAIECCKSGGTIVYSTCSILAEENEAVIENALSKYDISIVDTEMSIGEPGLTSFINKTFSPKMTLARRIYPHIHDLDGFFFCKLIKKSNNSKKNFVEVEINKNNSPEDEKLPDKMTLNFKDKNTKKITRKAKFRIKHKKHMGKADKKRK